MYTYRGESFPDQYRKYLPSTQIETRHRPRSSGGTRTDSPGMKNIKHGENEIEALKQWCTEYKQEARASLEMDPAKVKQGKIRRSNNFHVSRSPKRKSSKSSKNSEEKLQLMEALINCCTHQSNTRRRKKSCERPATTSAVSPRLCKPCPSRQRPRTSQPRECSCSPKPFVPDDCFGDDCEPTKRKGSRFKRKKKVKTELDPKVQEEMQKIADCFERKREERLSKDPAEYTVCMKNSRCNSKVRQQKLEQKRRSRSDKKLKRKEKKSLKKEKKKSKKDKKY